MATTRNQYLQASINQATFEIGSTNSHLAQLETHVKHKFDTMDAKFMKQFNTLQYVRENVRIQIGHYHLKSHMLFIEMGGCDIVLGVKWLRTLGPILMDFKELTMKFDQEGHQYKFQGIIVGSPAVISSHRMEKMLKKGHFGVIFQLHDI